MFINAFILTTATAVPCPFTLVAEKNVYKKIKFLTCFKLAANQKPKSSAREDASAAKKPAAAEKSASNLDDSLTRKKPGI